MIPQTYEQWVQCIVNDCKIPLNKAFAEKRLSVYQNTENAETKKFVELYGERHRQNIINWLQQFLQSA